MEPKTNEETMMRQSLLIIIAMLPWITAPVLASQPPVLVLQDVNVLSMENDRIATGQTVIVRDGVIAWIGARGEADVPEGAHVVTGPYYVIPGMAEMHAHIPSSNQGEQAMLDALTLYLANGITTIRGMLGQPAHLELRGKAARGEIVSPRIFTSGPGFSGGSVDSPETGRRMVREQAEAGYDLLKFHPGLTLDQFEAITEEANRIGIEFSGHISHAVGLERSLEAGKGSIDHLDRYMEFIAGEAAGRDDPPIIFFGYDLTPHVDVSLIPEAARLTREAGVWNVPTNTLLVNVFDPDLPTDEMMDWPGMEYISPRTASNWAQRVNSIRAGETYDSDQARRFLELRLKITRALHEEGGRAHARRRCAADLQSTRFFGAPGAGVTGGCGSDPVRGAADRHGEGCRVPRGGQLGQGAARLPGRPGAADFESAGIDPVPRPHRRGGVGRAVLQPRRT
jgi:hypothetical protein